MKILLLLTQSLVAWTPATTDTAGSPILPAGAEIQVMVRTVMEDGALSAWTAPVYQLVCEEPYINVGTLNGQTCQFSGSCHP